MNLRTRLKLAAGAAALAVAGCSSTGTGLGQEDAAPADLALVEGADLAGTTADLAATPADLTLVADLSGTAYPSGPYGASVGDVIPNLAWVGYPDEAADAVATTKALGSYSMQSLHASGRSYGFVHVSEVF